MGEDNSKEKNLQSISFNPSHFGPAFNLGNDQLNVQTKKEPLELWNYVAKSSLLASWKKNVWF